MNAAEQKSHKRTTDSLDQRLADVEIVVDRLMKNSEWLHRELTQLQLDFMLVRDRMQPLFDEVRDLESQIELLKHQGAVRSATWRTRAQWFLRGDDVPSS